MFYYKTNDAVHASPVKLPLPKISEQEYLDIIKSLEPTEEEIQEAKEQQLNTLLEELYPEKTTREAKLITLLNREYQAVEKI